MIHCKKKYKNKTQKVIGVFKTGAKFKKSRRTVGKVLYITPHHDVSNHFWHFMMGEFLPIMYVILKHKYKIVYLLKSKEDIPFPLNAFYYEVCKDAKVELHITDEELPDVQYIAPLNWDWKNRKEEYKLLWISRYLKKWASSTTCNTKIKTCVVQDRCNTRILDNFYKQYESHTNPIGAKRKIYGATRRHITNLKEVADKIQQEKQSLCVNYYQTDISSLRDQIQKYMCANDLILGHGAGMVHILWMQPKSRVIEIIPKSKYEIQDGAVQGARRLCKLLKFKLKRIVVENVHSKVNTQEVLDLITL